MSLRDFISGELAAVQEVEAVLTSREGKVFYVCTVVNESAPEIRRKIYEREQLIIDEFSDYEFDFDIISRHGRDMASFIGASDLEPMFQRQ